MKNKKCKVCQSIFTPVQFAQAVCGYKCAMVHSYTLRKQKEQREWRQEKAVLKDKLKTLSQYAKDLQKEVNTIVRLIDKGTQCISTLKPLNDKYDAGHFYSVGSNPALRFNLDNIHAQSVYANQYLSGDQINYLNGLTNIYGPFYQSIVIDLKSKYKIIKLTKEEYKEKIIIAKKIIKEINYDRLKFGETIYKRRTRLYLRNEYNKRLGIYK